MTDEWDSEKFAEYYEKVKGHQDPAVWKKDFIDDFAKQADYDRKKNLPPGKYIGTPGEYFKPYEFWEDEEKTRKKRNPDKKKFTNTKYKSKFGEQVYNPMANKFLPFVVESSTPHSIFRTLISRSKGLNRALVASVFNMTLNVDIKELRKHANNLDEMSLEQLYEELLQKHDIYRMNTDMLQHFTRIVQYFPDYNGWWDDVKLKDFEPKDVMMFLCVYSLNEKVGEYSNIAWKGLWDYEEIFSDFKEYIKLSDDGLKMEFFSIYELKTFILYRAVLHDQMEPDTDKLPICASFKK